MSDSRKRSNRARRYDHALGAKRATGDACRDVHDVVDHVRERLDVFHAPIRFNGNIQLGSIDRKSTRLNSSHTVISYAVFCLKKKRAQVTTYGLNQQLKSVYG